MERGPEPAHAPSRDKACFERRAFLRGSALAAAALATGRLNGGCESPGRADSRDAGPIDGASLSFLTELAAATIESARVRPGESRSGMGRNTTGITLITPGGNYPALWTRDFAMSLDCGLIDAAEILPQLLLVARCQNGEQERRLPSGAIVPPFAIVDHVNFAGGAVFYPGTYSSGEDQGAPPWGPLPPIDDHYYFVHIAYSLWRDGQDAGFLTQRTGEWGLLERLERAFHSPSSDPQTGAALATPARRAVGFGFQDSVQLLGSMSFATLLRYRAARQLEELHTALGSTRAASEHARTAEQIAAHLVPLFGDAERRDGWLVAATEVGRQPDVWATLFALHLGVLPADAAERALRSVAAAVRSPGNTIEYQGAVRHVPSDRYFRPDRCWESGGGTLGTYQSGAYWHTPTGWLIEALQAVDPALAREVCARYLDHLRGGDFRRSNGTGAPWECFGPALAGAQNPVYMTSVTLPLGVLHRLAIGRTGSKP